MAVRREQRAKTGIVDHGDAPLPRQVEQPMGAQVRFQEVRVRPAGGRFPFVHEVEHAHVQEHDRVAGAALVAGA